MITVYHNRDFMQYALDNFTTLSQEREIEYAHATVVARVNTDKLDEAYRLTNNIDSEWKNNAGVEPIGFEFRSTSVGDILMDAVGDFHIVETFGFRKLSPEEVTRITFISLPKESGNGIHN